MQGVRIRGMLLSSNLAKYQKESTVTKRPSTSRQGEPHVTLTSRNDTRDFRTFAQVASGKKGNCLSNSPPIILNPETTMSKRIRKIMLIREAHSLDHIANLPAPTLMNEGTKYLGGLRVAILFDSSKDAREFLEDKGRWKEWF